MDEKKCVFCVTVDTRAVYIKVKGEQGTLHSMAFTPSGVELTLALIEHLKAKYNVLIGRFLAEKLILEMGSAYSDTVNSAREIRARDLSGESSPPKSILITTEDVQNGILVIVNTIISTIRLNLKHGIPIEMHPQLNKDGISLEGDFAYLNGLDKRLQEALGVKVTIYSQIPPASNIGDD